MNMKKTKFQTVDEAFGLLETEVEAEDDGRVSSSIKNHTQH